MDHFLSDKMTEIKDFIDGDICQINHVDEIAGAFGLSRNCLHEWFKMTYKVSLKEYILNRKLEKLIELIQGDTDNNIVFYFASTLGFKTSSGLCNMVKRMTGMTFEEFRRYVRVNGKKPSDL